MNAFKHWNINLMEASLNFNFFFLLQIAWYFPTNSICMFFLFYLQHRTPLHCAAGTNKTDCMLALIDKGGAFIDARDKNVRFLLLVIRSPIWSSVVHIHKCCVDFWNYEYFLRISSYSARHMSQHICPPIS